ncbi:hypothetical protein [Blautia sp. MSJ-19]|uniref:hypothetical protein n=1 Tax=Blautia sp. MSJ-19 TaxID=2841517 RepID=UPI001C0E9FF4|nr:hypothetical protein [Blautia sp. MSJ-19]MBU5479843.1 hypothetical protein [Blautia sp. MSJ-19]
MNKDKKSKTKILILLLILVTVVSIVITVWAVFFRNTSPILAPDHAPQTTEENAEKMKDDGTEKMEAEEGGGAVSITYANEVTIDLKGKKAILLFANPQKSIQNMVVQLVIDNTVIVQSDILEPGNQVRELDLPDNAEKQLVKGGYDGKFVVSFYDPDSGEKASVNTEIPVSVTVS